MIDKVGVHAPVLDHPKEDTTNLSIVFIALVELLARGEKVSLKGSEIRKAFT